MELDLSQFKNISKSAEIVTIIVEGKDIGGAIKRIVIVKEATKATRKTEIVSVAALEKTEEVRGAALNRRKAIRMTN